ncbi:hypothetical protein [Streptomyces sp. 6N223]|uniref:hypothetical protein n=1 Tax=Streptomyces sp. 6N223 TaxID=3457412 RepID=UPI003FCFC3F3
MDAIPDASALAVRDARAAAARWVRERAALAPDFAGAYFSGSTIWREEDAELAASSDVDVVVMTTRDEAPLKPGKFRWDGVLVEATYQSWQRLPSPEAVLGDYHLAGCFRSEAPAPVADPSGGLTALREAVAPRFARPEWVRARVAHAERRVADGMAAVPENAAAGMAFHAQVMCWLFPGTVTTHVLLSAGLRNPTIRLRFPAARELLAERGIALDPAYEELLGLLGCAGMSRARVEGHLAALTRAFDQTARVLRVPSPFFFASDISPEARPIAIDGSLALIERGLHREAVFWIAATFTRCLAILDRDAPPEVAARHMPAFAELTDELGIGTPEALAERAREVAAYLPRLRATAEAVMVANSGIS